MTNNMFHGVFRVRREGEWYIPERFTDQQLESYSVTRDLQIRSLAPAGCKLAFYSRARSLEFTYRITGKARNWAAFDVCEDGLLTDTVLVSEDVGRVKFTLSGDENVKTEIFLPHLVELAIKDMKADAPIKAIEKEEKLWLCLGDSITQGMDAVNPSITYPVLAAKLLNYDVLNMGVGGAMFCADNLDKIDREPDLITVALGCNDWGSVEDEEALRNNISRYLHKLTSLYKCRKIFGILPIWRSDADTIRSGMTFEQMRQAVKEEYEKYSFISVLDGMALMPAIKTFYGDAGELKVHPNEKGFLYYAMNLAKKIGIEKELLSENTIFSNAGAKWIGREGICGNEPAPAPLLRKCFSLHKNVREAVVYVSGLGQYEGFINGKPLDERIVFAPAFSDYTKTVYYNQYSVGDKLVAGDNVLAFVLGRGRYAFNTPNTPWDGEKAAWVDAVKMIAVLEVRYDDGSIETIVTDEDWEAKASGIVQDCMYRGETFDARLHDPSWNQAVEGSGWKPCTLMAAPAGKLKYDTSEPITICERIKPVSITKVRERVYVYKFEEYVTGWMELKLTCPRDSMVTIQYGERLDAHGEVLLQQAVTDDRLQCDFFWSSGETFVYRPRFSYKGFYYVQVEGAAELTLEDAVACYIHNDVKSISSFACSDDMINWFHHAFRRTVLSNLQGVTSDTPVFEKLGWTGDANAVAPAVLMNFDMRRFYRKWLDDFRDSQTIYGEIPTIIPTTGWSLEGSKGWAAVEGPVPAWDICYPELVYRMYWCYGDEAVLADHYGALKKYVTYLTKCANGGLFEKGLGDWLSPSGDPERDCAGSPEGPALISGAYHIRIFEFMQKIAAALGKVSDEEDFAKERKRLIGLYHDIYFDTERMYYKCKQYDGFRQAPNVLALAFGIVPEEYRNAVLQHILDDVKRRDYHHCMGVITVHHLLNVLSEEGYHEVAYRILTVKGYPGWDYQREFGLRTLSESWECKASRSFCHYACGAADAWVLTYLAGVHQLEAGFRKVRIAPLLPEGMNFVQYSLDTVNGRIEVRCERRNGQIMKTVRTDARIEVLE